MKTIAQATQATQATQAAKNLPRKQYLRASDLNPRAEIKSSFNSLGSPKTKLYRAPQTRAYRSRALRSGKVTIFSPESVRLMNKARKRKASKLSL